MEQLTNFKHKIDFLISDNTSLIQSTQTTAKRKIYEKCKICNKRRRPLDKSHHICRICHKMKTIYMPSGNKIIDDFIKYTQINLVKNEGKMVFVPYDRIEKVEFIAEGGFSKIYKAIWIDGPISEWGGKGDARQCDYTVALKELNNSKNITSKELNELKIFYDFALKWKANRDKNRKTMKNEDNSDNSLVYKYHKYGFYNYISKYFGITQNPITQNFMIIMPYYESGDLTHYICNNFLNIDWEEKLRNLLNIIIGLMDIHSADIIHRDLHSGNIFFDDTKGAIVGDLSLSKSAIDDDDNEIYGIIPYVSPEVFQGQEYAKASDIYSFGMIMWELMTGRRPFWDRSHDTDLIIEICDGLRPPIVTDAPKGYIELMKKCWHSDPEKRPTATDLYKEIVRIRGVESHARTAIIVSPDIGPITVNNPGAIYKSRPLSVMTKSANLTRSLITQSIILEFGKNKFIDNLFENNNEDKIAKKLKLWEDKNENYFTKELSFDINNVESSKSNNNYNTKELDFDI